MRNITIGRYKHESVTTDWDGYIEGTRDDGSTWIMWLDADGSPTLFWPRRDETGAVVGEPVHLTPPEPAQI